MTKHFWIRAGLVLVTLVIIGGLALAYLGQEAHMVEARVDSPAVVFVGQPFDVNIHLSNLSDDDREIVSIGLETETLQVVETVPGYRSIDAGGQWTEYIFSRRLRPTLSPDGELNLRLQLLAITPSIIETEIVLWFHNGIRGDYVPLKVHAIRHPMPWLGR